MATEQELHPRSRIARHPRGEPYGWPPMSGPSTDGVRVSGIVGAPRSGTTILTRVLGESDGFFAVGEIHNIRQDMLTSYAPGDARLEVPRLVERTSALARLGRRSAPRTCSSGARAHAAASPRLDWSGRGPPAALVSLRRNARRPVPGAVAETTGSRVVVDSSKNSRYYSLPS